MSPRPAVSLHHVTAADHRRNTDEGLYTTPEGLVAFDIDATPVFFDSPADFVAWLDRLNELAANTPAVAALIAASSPVTVQSAGEAVVPVDASPAPSLPEGCYAPDPAGDGCCDREAGHDGNHRCEYGDGATVAWPAERYHLTQALHDFAAYVADGGTQSWDAWWAWFAADYREPMPAGTVTL